MPSITANTTAVSYLGGDRITLHCATWPAGMLTVSALDPSQNASFACVTGRPGSMQATVALGQTLTVYAPQLTRASTSITLSVIQANLTVFGTLSLAVVPPFYASCVFDIRDLLPSNWALGATSIADVSSLGY